MTTDDETLWKDAVSVPLSIHHKFWCTSSVQCVQIVGVNSTPPTLFVRAVFDNPHCPAVAASSTDSESITVRDALPHVVNSVLDYLWTCRPILRRYSFRELEKVGAIWVRRKTVDNNRSPNRTRKNRKHNKFQRFVVTTTGRDSVVERKQRNNYDDGGKVGLDWSRIYFDSSITIRIHSNPSRFPMGRWLKEVPEMKDRIVVDETESMGMVILNKPGGIPSHPTVDNSSENALFLVQKFDQQMHHHNNQSDVEKHLSTVPNRLDIDTSGLQMVCTTTFASYFGKLLEDKTTSRVSHYEDELTFNGTGRRLRKTYRCLVCIRCEDRDKEIPHAQTQYQTLQNICECQTIVTHYVDKNDRRAPKTYFLPQQLDSQSSTWLDCRLKILRVGPLIKIDRIERKDENNHKECAAGLAVCLWKDKTYRPPDITHVAELEIDLLTGRTHQIRGQLAAMGHPLVGDSLYGGTMQSIDGSQTRRFNSLALQCCKVEFPKPQKIKDISKKKKVGARLIPGNETLVYTLDHAWWTEMLMSAAPISAL
jgi:23S rRNA-/tRNA-specific pseudouridylate synthase